VLRKQRAKSLDARIVNAFDLRVPRTHAQKFPGCMHMHARYERRVYRARKSQPIPRCFSMLGLITSKRCHKVQKENRILRFSIKTKEKIPAFQRIREQIIFSLSTFFQVKSSFVLRSWTSLCRTSEVNILYFLFVILV